MNTTRMERSIAFACHTLRRESHALSEYVAYYCAHRDADRAYEAHKQFMATRDAWCDIDTLRRDLMAEVGR